MRYKGTQILPGISFIGWLDGTKLQRATGCAKIVGQNIGIFTTIHEIQFCGEPDCRCKTERDGGGYKDTTTLKFQSVDRVPCTQMRNIAFVVTDVNGKSYFIGSLEAPRATVECEHITGIPSGDAAGYANEVKHASFASLVPCVISVDL